jgi:hypothetical protein
MSPAYRRRGRVVDTAGRPVPGAFVTVTEGPVPVPEIALVTGKEGEFAMALPEGRFRVRATGPEGATGEADWTGEGDDEILVTIRRPQT